MTARRTTLHGQFLAGQFSMFTRRSFENRPLDDRWMTEDETVSVVVTNLALSRDCDICHVGPGQWCIYNSVKASGTFQSFHKERLQSVEMYAVSRPHHHGCAFEPSDHDGDCLLVNEGAS